MKGYKFLLKGYKSAYGDFTYEIGNTYEHEGEIKLCKSGFHYSREIRDAFLYVNGDHCVEIEAGGNIIEDDSKCVCSEITIVKELNITEILEILSKDENSGVRCVVTENQNTSSEILEILSKDKDVYVRYAVAKNQSISIEILKILSGDKDGGIRNTARENINKRK